MDELELELKSMVDHLLSSSPISPHDAVWCDEYRFVTVNFEKDINNLEYRVRFYYEPDSDTFSHTIWEREFSNDVWDMISYYDMIPVARTEEEYFQHSTLYDFEFSLEFYQYLLSILE